MMNHLPLRRLPLAAFIAAAGINGGAEAFLQPSSTSARSFHLLESNVDLQEEVATSSTATDAVKEEGSNAEKMVIDIPPTPSEVAEMRARSQKAKETWSTVALQPTSDKRKEIPLNGESTIVYNQKLFDEFCTVRVSRGSGGYLLSAMH